MLNQKPLVQSFLSGEIVGTRETPEYVETAISHIFLFQKKVYKLYKNDNYEFNTHFRNISSGRSRKKFYASDFSWNRYFSPTIYQVLVPVYQKEGLFSLRRPGIAVDQIIIMRRVDVTKNLTKLLISKKISNAELRHIGKIMMKKIKSFPETHPKLSYQRYLEIRLDSLNAFMKIIPGTPPYARRSDLMRLLHEHFVKHKKYFADFKKRDISIAIDNHADNIFLLDGKANFIDVYSPKEEWGYMDPLFNAARLAADVSMYANKFAAREVVKGFSDAYPHWKISEDILQFYALQAALIKGTYLFLLNDVKRKREAKRYWARLEKCVKEGKIL